MNESFFSGRSNFGTTCKCFVFTVVVDDAFVFVVLFVAAARCFEFCWANGSGLLAQLSPTRRGVKLRRHARDTRRLRY